MEKTNSRNYVRKLDKDHFVDLRTGEYREYRHSENRAGNEKGIKRSIAKVSALVNTNILNHDSVRWVTLTYSENMTDRERLQDDYKKFWLRFCYWCEKENFGKPEYISVVEPQGRGAWHIHAFFIWHGEAPFIPHEVLSVLWGLGGVSISALDRCNSVGAYFSAYLSDMPLEEFDALPEDEKKAAGAYLVQEKEVQDGNGQIVSRQFVKGARLHLYPVGMNIYRRSGGIRIPKVSYMPYASALNVVEGKRKVYSNTFEFKNEAGETINTVSKDFYRRG